MPKHNQFSKNNSINKTSLNKVRMNKQILYNLYNKSGKRAMRNLNITKKCAINQQIPCCYFRFHIRTCATYALRLMFFLLVIMAQ